MSEINRPILPPKYYLDNFNFLLDFVAKKYGDILNDTERDFYEKYDALSEDARCLLIRFITRKGVYFRKESLKYAEISDIDICLEELMQADFICEIPDFGHFSLSDFTKFLNKNELVEHAGIPKFKNYKKEEIINYIFDQGIEQSLLNSALACQNYFCLCHEKAYSFIIFLFFGNRYHNLTEFVLRDLGIQTYEKLNEDAMISQFATRQEADDKWMISIYRETFEDLKKTIENAELKDWILNIHDNYASHISEVAMPAFQKLMLAAATEFEKRKEFESAIEIYQLVEIVPARERQVRCFIKLKRPEEALFVCQDMVATFKNADELFFAENQIEKLQGNLKKRKQTTDKLADAESITISSEYRYQVEYGTQIYYTDLGFEAHFSENFTFRAMFGLSFWDIIYDESLSTFHHPLQKRPSDLYKPGFLEKRQERFEERLNSFLDADKWILFIAEVFVEKEGIVNPFVVWVEEVWVMVRRLLECLEIDKIKQVLREMSKNLVDNSRGFPDLMLTKENELSFIEVKSPTDSLSNQQLFWLRFFEEIGIEAKVLRVYYD